MRRPFAYATGECHAHSAVIPTRPDSPIRLRREPTVTADVDVFAASDGGFYTPSQIRRRRRAGTWRFCLRDRESGRLVFETDDRTLCLLVPVDPDDLPPWVEVRLEGGFARAVDTRRGVRRPRRVPACSNR